MNEDNLRGIAIVTYPIDSAFSIPITNLASVLSAFSKTYLFLGTTCQIDFQKSNNLVYIRSIPHHPGPSKLKQIFRYGILQLKIIRKLVSRRKNIESVIFFMETPPFLPMVVAKILNHKIYWLLPSMFLPLSKDISTKILTLPSRICYILCNNIILYSPSLITEWNIEKYHRKILIAHRHFLDFNAFTVNTPLADRPPLIGYIGRLSEEKGVQHFVQALPSILSNRQDLSVLIGGDGQLMKSIKASLQEGEFIARVDLPGWISHNDLPIYLNQLRLLVLPSYTEGLPNIMLEAMACGTPVLATPVGAIPDVIIDGKTGYIAESNSPECLAKNVVRALNSPGLEQIAENGRRFVEETFTFERVVTRWKEVFEDI